jgi:hypothetical protein
MKMPQNTNVPFVIHVARSADKYHLSEDETNGKKEKEIFMFFHVWRIG